MRRAATAVSIVAVAAVVIVARLPAMSLKPSVSPVVWALPNPTITPGATNPDVTQANIDSTICVRGWTRTVRPPEHYTYVLKRQQISRYGYDDWSLRDYEEDHLIPLELGGAPADPRNLWPEPRRTPNGWGAARKDELEWRLNRLVCSGQLPLAEAQHEIATNWIAAFEQRVKDHAFKAVVFAMSGVNGQ